MGDFTLRLQEKYKKDFKQMRFVYVCYCALVKEGENSALPSTEILMEYWNRNI